MFTLLLHAMELDGVQIKKVQLALYIPSLAKSYDLGLSWFLN